MKTEEFVKEVMIRAGLDSRLKAQDAIRATLETLSEHLTDDEVDKVASQLPPEIANYMHQPFVAGIADRFSINEFYRRVVDREGVDMPEAVRNTKVVAEVLSETVSPGQIGHMCAQLPDELADIFRPQRNENRFI